MPWAVDRVDLDGLSLEVGPGPGVTTSYLSARVRSLTVIERDPLLAGRLTERFPTVRVIEGDATAMPFESGSFRTVFSFTMLHHVPSVHLQDRLLAEAFRVLEPGGVFLGTDSRMSVRMRIIHWFDTLVIVDPLTFSSRLLRQAGFGEVETELAAGAFRFRALRPTRPNT